MATFTPSKENKVYYLAGPMSGIPQFNYPAFYRIADKLREMGYTIQSPAELDTHEQQVAAMASPDGAHINGGVGGLTWGDTLAKDVKLISDVVDGIIAMPTWWKSRGARLELFVALLCKKPVWVYEEEDNFFFPLTSNDILELIGGEKKEEQGQMEAATKRA